MGYVLKAVLSSAQHPEYGQITVPFPIPDEKYDRMIELLEPLEIGDALRQDCRVDELDSFYTVLNRLVGSLVNFDELDYLAKRLDSFDDGEAAQFQGMACKLGVSNIKDFINLTFCCQQATVITDFSDLDAIGRQHYMTMQGGGCRIEELERLDGRKFALDLILNHLEGRITPYGVVYDNGMKLEQLYDGRHFPCYHYQPNLLAVGLSSRQEPENTDQITWLLLPCSEQQLQRGIARSGVNIHDARIWYEDSLLPSEVEEVLEGQREDLFALNDMATAIAALSDLEQKKLTAVMEMAKPECAGEIRELAKNLELFEFAPKVRTPAEYGRYMIQDSGHYEYDPNLEEFYDYERYGKLRMEKETGAFTEKGYQMLSQDSDAPVYRMRAITDALQKSGAKTVNVTVQKDGVELTFKTSAESLKGLKSQYSTWYIAPSDRLQFRHLFGAGSDYSAEDIIRIAYGRSTLYEAPSAPAEDIEMQGMSL